MAPSFNIFKSSKKKAAQAAAAAASADTAPAAPRASHDGGGSVAGKSSTSKLVKKKKKNSISQSIAPTPTAEEVELDYVNEKFENEEAHMPNGAELNGGHGHSVRSFRPSLPVVRSMNGSGRAMHPYQDEDGDFVLIHPHRVPTGAPEAAFMSNAGSQYARSTRQMHPDIYDDPSMFPPTYPSQPTRYEAGLRYPKFVSSITGTPVVSQYIPADPHHPPPPPPMAEVPSRSWSPIPSVEREESPRDEMPGQGDQSWVPYDDAGHTGHPGGLLLAPSNFPGDSDPRISTMAEGGNRASAATLEYVDNTGSTHQIISRPLVSHPSMSRSMHAPTHGEQSLYGDRSKGDSQGMIMSRPLPSNHSAAQSHILVPEHGSRPGSRMGSQAGSFDGEHEHIRRVSSPTTILPRKPLQSHPSQSHSHSHSRSHGSMGAHLAEHPSMRSLARSHATGHASQAPGGFEHHEFEDPHEEEILHVMPMNRSAAPSQTMRPASQMHEMEHGMEFERAHSPQMLHSSHSIARSHATAAPSQAGHAMPHEHELGHEPSAHTLHTSHSLARSHATGTGNGHAIPSNHSVARSRAPSASHPHEMDQERALVADVPPSTHSLAGKSQRTAHGSLGSHAPGKSSDHLSVSRSNVVIPSKPISSRHSVASKHDNPSLAVPSRNASAVASKASGKENRLGTQSSRSIVNSPPMMRGRWISTPRSTSRSRSRSPYYPPRRRRRSTSSDTRSRSPIRSRGMRPPPFRRRRSFSPESRSISPVHSRTRDTSTRQTPPKTPMRNEYVKTRDVAAPSMAQLPARPSRHTNSGSWGDDTPIERPVRRPRGPSAIEPGIIEQEYWDDKELVLDIYHYIVPIGVKVMFQDEEGNMILRMAKTGKVLASTAAPPKCAPIVVHDANGTELYRSTSVRGPSNSRTAGDLRSGKLTRRHDSLGNTPLTKTIMIDETGKQIVLKA